MNNQHKDKGLPALELLRIMALAREGDRREGILIRQGKGWFGVASTGHEAVAALMYCLEPKDYLHLYYRDRALALVRGVTNYELALAYLGKNDSSSIGRQMPSFFSAPNLNIFSNAPPTGLQFLPAAGTAWANKLDGNGAITICCTGDATTRQGEFYESLCFALEKDLPLLFVVEDNGYGISTPTSKMTPWNIGALSKDCMVKVNGRDAFEVYNEGRRVVEKIRSGQGPMVLWLELDRLTSHTSSDDHRVYRSTDEIEEMLGRDPINLLRDELIKRGELTMEGWQEETQAIARQVDDDYLRAEQSANPDPSRTMEQILAPPPPPQTSNLPPQETWMMVTAVNETLHNALASDPKVIMFGEDVEDPKGGVFGITKGLSSKYPERIVNSPLAEASIAGIGGGLAMAGYKPVFEIQFIDFALPAFNQIANQIATLRWRSNGAFKCPLVLIAPCGAYLPSGGPWHSQTAEGLYAHLPGLQIVMPSTPHDASSLLKASIASDDPVLFLLPKHLFRKHFQAVPDEPLTLGEAIVRVEGQDATAVVWGNCVEVAIEAAEKLAKEDIALEVVDLQTLVPCDWKTIQESVAKTGRLIVVQEDNVTCSFGQAIVSEIISRPESWDVMAAPPQLITRPDVHIAYHAILEEHILPSVAQVCDAVRKSMRY